MSNNILSDILPFVDDIGWVCPTCREAARSALQQLHSSHSKLCDATAELKENFRKIKAEVSSLQNKVGKLTARDGEFSAQLEQLKTDNENHRTAHPQPPVAWPTNEATNQVLTAVHKELSEKHRRQRNVVVTGLESSDTVADVDLFLQMCEDCMPLKPYVDKNKCRRLGKAQQGKPRPFLVVLDNEESANELRKNACLLHGTDVYCNVYINPDLTRAEAQAAYEERDRRRKARIDRHTNRPQQDSHVSPDGDVQQDSVLSAMAPEFVSGQSPGIINSATNCV